MNFLSGELVSGTSERAQVKLKTGELVDAMVDASALKPGQPVTVGIRPEHAQLGTATQSVVREVQWQERLGESTYLFLNSGVANEPLVVKAPGQARAETGQRVAISLPTASLHVFDEKGHALERRIPIADLLIPHAA